MKHTVPCTQVARAEGRGADQFQRRVHAAGQQAADPAGDLAVVDVDDVVGAVVQQCLDAIGLAGGGDHGGPPGGEPLMMMSVKAGQAHRAYIPLAAASAS